MGHRKDDEQMNTQLISFILFSFISDEKKKEEKDVYIWQVIDSLIKFKIN
jgi:hypothetical protein